VDQPVLIEETRSGEDPVDGSAERGLAGSRFDLAGKPILKEEAGDTIAGFEARNGRAHGSDNTGCVGA
jgi:hypothetical protein